MDPKTLVPFVSLQLCPGLTLSEAGGFLLLNVNGPFWFCQFVVGLESKSIVFSNKTPSRYSRHAVQSLQVLKRKFWKSLKKRTMQSLQIFSSRQ